MASIQFADVQSRPTEFLDFTSLTLKALELPPQVLDSIVSLKPHDFQRLHNPLMRRLMSPRITLGRIARMTHVPIAEILAQIGALSGATVQDVVDADNLPQSPHEPPRWITETAPERVQEVSLLPLDAALDADPLPPVMRAVKALAPGNVVRLRHQWEQPFYDMWSKMGHLEWFAEQMGSDEWHIWVRRTL